MLELLPATSVITGDLTTYPRHGMSIAGIVVSSAANIPETVARFADCGVQSTRVNLLSALWAQTDTLPFRRRSDGLWNLKDWNPVYFARLEDCCYRMNRAGIAVQWSNYELYSWSKRKSGPQQIGTPWRHNVNGVFWAEDDSTFGVLPDWWSMDWIEKVTPSLDLTRNVFEIGNEFPEKALHQRVRALLPKEARVQVNRNEDTPGQYANMKIGRDFEAIAFHGNRLKTVADLDRVYPREPTYKTFNQFFDRCLHDPKRITFSSDGARVSDDPIDTYDWPTLREFFREVERTRKCSIEHQSRAKMTPFPNHKMIETDWFASVIA